jgi:hypothetical protein
MHQKVTNFTSQEDYGYIKQKKANFLNYFDMLIPNLDVYILQHVTVPKKTIMTTSHTYVLKINTAYFFNI